MVRRISQSFSASPYAALLLVQVGARDDGIHQIALILHQAQRTFEMRFAGMQIERLAQNVYALVEVGLGLDLTIDRRDEGGEIPAAAAPRCRNGEPGK